MPKNDALEMMVENGALTIRVGVSTLAFALLSGEVKGLRGAVITDKEGFAREILNELDGDEDDGSHPFYQMLGAAACEALHSGSKCCELPEDTEADDDSDE